MSMCTQFQMSQHSHETATERVLKTVVYYASVSSAANASMQVNRASHLADCLGKQTVPFLRCVLCCPLNWNSLVCHCQQTSRHSVYACWVTFHLQFIQKRKFAIINMAFYRHRTKGDKQEYRAPWKVPCYRQQGGELNYTLWKMKGNYHGQSTPMVKMCINLYENTISIVTHIMVNAHSIVLHLQCNGPTHPLNMWSSADGTISQRHSRDINWTSN